MAESRKIGEGRVDLTANAQPLEAGLESAKRSTENWAQSVTGAARNVGAAIATAYAAFRVGDQIGQAIANMRDLTIVTQDYRRAVGQGAADAFGENQMLKRQQRIDVLKRQFAEIGNAAGAGTKIAQQEFEKSVREAADRTNQRIEAATEKAFEGAKSNVFFGGQLGIALNLLGYRSEFAAYQEAAKAVKALNSELENTIKLKEQDKALTEAMYEAMSRNALRAIQEAQRAGFTLGDQVLDESVVNRELDRIFTGGPMYRAHGWTPPAQGRY